MRRSSAVKLTLLPMLASAAAAAQPAPEQLPPGPPEPVLAPPGLTPTIDDCRNEPDNPLCAPVYEDDVPLLYQDSRYVHGGYYPGGHRPAHCVFHGGFGHYFSGFSHPAGARGGARGGARSGARSGG